jgi:hypothetical protein
VTRGYRVGYGEPDSDLETLDRRGYAEPEQRREAAFDRGQVSGETEGHVGCSPFAWR